MTYRNSCKLSALTVALLSVLHTASAAPVVQVTTALESSQFVDGLNITDGKPSLSLAADLSFDNGSFGGLGCYRSNQQVSNIGIDARCNYYLGYFRTLDNEQAFSATITRSEYTPIPIGEWDYTTAALSWHASPSITATVSAVDNWFGRGYSAVGFNASYQLDLNQRWSANLEGHYLNFEGSAPANSTADARIGLRFERGQWAGELNIHIAERNHDLRQFIPFSIDQPKLSARISYRMY
jgi:hypothetical protein